MNWGECYYDHYVRYFGNPVDREVFKQSPDLPSLQILMFDKVVSGCRVFATLGLTHYIDEIHGVRECFMPVDAGWDDAPEILANTLFFAIQNKLEVCRGLTVSGISNINAVFAETYDKEAIYIADPFGLPDELSVISCNGQVGELYVAMLISRSEHQFKIENGAQRFEDELERSQTDPYAIARRPII
jgi:antitoxin YqcF